MRSLQVDEAQIAQQQSAYGPVVDAEEAEAAQPGKKRKATPTNDDSVREPDLSHSVHHKIY